MFSAPFRFFCRLHLGTKLRWVSFLFLLGCEGCKVTREQSLVGVYRAVAPCVNVTLSLRRDHSFTQVAMANQHEVNRLTGTWRVDPDGTVMFDGFIDFVNDPHGVAGKGTTGFRAERWPRGLMMGPVIVRCADSGYKVDYVK